MRPDVAGPESLERRQLMTASPILGSDDVVAFVAGQRPLVVVDGSRLATELVAGSFGDAETLVVEAGDDVFSAVSARLGELGGTSAIHLVSHGAPGSFSLGVTRFAADMIDEIAEGLLAWNRLAGPGADLFVWGCDVAAADGASLIDALHSVSGFDVAASTDLTGPARLGGDFDLEYAAGDVASPRLLAGVDVLWDTTLAAPADHTFTTASKEKMQDAFTALADTIAPEIKAAVAAQTGSSSTDPTTTRTIADLFTASSSISPTDLESFLSLKTTVSTYLGGASPTLSGLATAISSALASKASAAEASSTSITVTPTASASQISLAVSITATGSPWADIEQGTEEVPTAWGKAIRTMNSDYGATFRGTPQVRAGSRLSTGFTVSVRLTGDGAPEASITIGSTSLEAGVFEFSPLRFGILDATIAIDETLPYSTNVSFTGGATRTVADWSAVGASASAVSGTPSSTVELPITAMIGDVDVAPGATFLVTFSPLPTAPPVVTADALGLLPWFGNISSDDIIVGVKAVGGAYATLVATESLGASIPFVDRTALADVFDFSDLFDDAIGSVIDVTVDTTVGSGPTAQTIKVRPDDLQTLADFQNYPAFAALGITPVYNAEAGTVSLQFTASRTTPLSSPPEVTFNIAPLGALEFTGGTSPALSPTVSLGFGIQFEVGPGSPIVIGLGMQPPSNGKVGADTAVTFSSGDDTWEVTVTPAATDDNSSFADLVADFNAALATAREVVGGVVSRTTTDIRDSFEFTGAGGRVSVVTKGAAPTTVLDGQLVPTLTLGRLSGDATFTITPVGGSTTTVTVTKESTETNTSLADLIDDVNDALGGSSLLRARASEFGVGIELYTPTIDSTMPIGITVAATRNQGAIDLGFSDGIELSEDTEDTPITIFGRPTGVKSLVVPHADPTKKFAESTIDWSLADRSGSVAYGINTVAFGDTAGAVQAAFSAVLDAEGAAADELAVDPFGTLDTLFTDAATLTLSNLSRVGGTNDIASGATITIAVSDFLAERIDSFVAFGGPLSVPGLEGSGQSTGRLSADSTIRFTVGGATYDVTVTQAAAAGNATFQDLVSDFNVALSAARLVVDGSATSTTVDLAADVSFIGSGGRVSVMHSAGGVTYPVLENLLVANLAAGGTTTGRLASTSSLTLVRGPDTYTVTVPASDTTGNTTFADLVADFNAALAAAQKRTGSTTTTVDATDVLRFSAAAIAGRIQPEANQSVANPGYAVVTLPPTADLGEVGFQAGLSVPTIAAALTQASRVFDAIERDLEEFNSQELPLLNQSLGDLIDLDAGFAGRIAAFGKLSASSPQQLERALETALGVPSTDLRITYDSALKAYRIDVAYRASKATTIAFDVDLYRYYEELGRVLPKGIDALTDGESKTPLNVVINATSVLSVGYDLTTNQTFLYGHDGSASRGVTNGTSFTVSFSVNGQNLEFPAKFGLDVRKGVARLQNGSLAVTLTGAEGTPASSLFYVAPTGSQRAALNVANYTAEFGGAVSVKMPIFDAFAPANPTQASVTEAQESGVFGFIQDHPASFYLAMPNLGDYLDARSRMEAAQTAITSLLSRGQTVDADGVSLATWQDRLNLAAADLGGVLFAFAPELENTRNLLGAEETLLDFVRDPAMILDKLNAAIGAVESTLKGLDKIPLPFMEGKLGGAVNSVFSFRTGWLLDMRNKMRGAGEGLFDVMREAVFEYLGPKHANILLKYDPVSMDRSLDSMTAATRPEDIGVVFMDKQRNVLASDVRGADAFEIVFRLGQKVFDTGIDMSFQLDALENIGIGAAFDGGLRLQVGWEMVLGFGFSITDGFYLKVDGTQPEAQLRFDATLTGASKDYTQRWDADGGYWKIVDTKGTSITTDDQDVIDATTGEAYRAIAVNKFAADVTAFVDDPDTAPADPCDCGEPPSATRFNEPIWWVVGTKTGNGDYVPAELNEQGRYVPQASPYAHTLIEVSAMRPAQLSGSLFFLRLAATDKIRRGLTGFTDVDSQYFYDASEGPQTTAAERDDEEIGVNRNNELPTRFTASVGLNVVDPSAFAKKYSVREDGLAPVGSRRVVNEKGQDVAGNSGAIYKPGRVVPVVSPTGWGFGGSVDREIEGVYAKKYYELKLKIAPPAKYQALDIPVRVATGANVSLSGMGIVDGVQLKVGDRVLVKNQAIASQNGIYTVSPGAWSRSFDANDTLDFRGKPMFVLVSEGRSNKDTGWNLVDSTFSAGDVVVGTTPLIFERTMISVFEPGALGQRFERLKLYTPYKVLPLLADWVDNPLAEEIKINIEYDAKNYLVILPAADGILRGPAIRAAQLNQALMSAVADDNKNLKADAGEETYNLGQAGFIFQLPASAQSKWYRIEFAHLVEDDTGFAKRYVQRVGNFIDYGTPSVINLIDTWRGWDPVADINADTTKNRLTWSEFRGTPIKEIFKLDYQATAVANLTMELSVGDTASSQNLVIPRIYADFNLDWSTRAARAKIEKAKQEVKDQSASSTQPTSGSQPDDDDYGDSLRSLFAEEDETASKTNTGADQGIDPASPLVKEMDLRPEIGFSNIRLDVGSFLTDFLKPVVDKAEPYLAEVRPILTFLNSRVPVLSDVAGRTIKVVDLLEKFGGPKAQGIRGVIDTVTAIDNLVAQIAALPPGVNIQLPMGRFWFPKVADPNKGGYKYGDLQYDNVALGINTNDYTDADRDAEAALQALAATSPDSQTQKNRQSNYSNSAQDRGGLKVPILEDPLTLFNLMMGKTATLVTFQLPKLQYSFEKNIPLVRIVCFEVGLRASFEMNSNLAFGFDTYGINQYMVSGDALDIAQGFYVSDRANADGTGADVPEFQAIVSLGLYGGVDLVAAKAGIEGGVRVTGEVNLNDPNNDGKLRLTEAIGLVIDTENPLDLFDLSLRGDAYARYYYRIGVGKLSISGGKDFARITLFNLVHEGSDGTPLYGSVVDGSEGAEALPGTLLLHVGEAAAKRVSNTDPLKAKDGAESFVIWNDAPGSDTVHVKYVNYSGSRVRTYTGVQRVLFEGGIGDDTLDASSLYGLPVSFDGGDGNDSLILGSGHAEIVSRLAGGDGNDSITVHGDGLIEILGGVGNDTLTGGTGIVRIEAGEGNDSVTTRAGSTSTIVMAEDYGMDTAALATAALQNLLDFTRVASAIEFLLDGALGATVDGTATAGEKNVLTFNVGGATEIRGSTQADSFSVRNPRTRSVPRHATGLSGLLLRGGQGDDLYDFVLDSVSNMDSDGISIDDVQAVTPATAGAVTRCGPCNKIESIAVANGGRGYDLPPQVMILDPTGSGAQATATLDENGIVTSIQIIEGGKNYTNPTVLLVAPRSLGDKLEISSVRPTGNLFVWNPVTDVTSRRYEYDVDNKRVRFMGWGDAARPAGLDQSEIDSVTINMPEGVLTLASAVNLFQTFTVNASRMVQNARIVADTVAITTDHGFQVKHPIHAVNSGDVKLRVTGDGTSTGEGDLNAEENLAKATAVVSGGTVTGLTIANAGSHYHFNPSVTVGSDGATPGTGARFEATLVGNGGGLAGFTRLAPGSGYYTSPAPVVVVPPPASIQIDAMITSSLPNSYQSFGAGNGRGRVLLFADTGAVSTSGEVAFPNDVRPGMPQNTPMIDWIGGDFRYRNVVGLDDLVNPAEHPGISVGLGAEFKANLDSDGRVISFTQVSGGSGYSADLPPLVEIEGLATAVPTVGPDGSITNLAVTYPGDGYGQPPRVTIRPNGFGRIVNSPNGAGGSSSADGVTPMNRVHIRALGGKLVAVAGTGVGDPLKPLKSDVETFVAAVSAVGGGVHVLEKDGLRIGKDQSVSGITTVNGDVSITTFGGTLELGAPRQALDEEGRPLWQDAAKTIPIYDRDPVTGRIIYEGGDIAVGSGDVKLTADDIEVNVDLNASGGSGTITLQPVRMDAEIGLAGTRARVAGVITDGKLTGFDATTFWGGRGYTAAPLVIVDPAGQRAYASAVVEAGAVTAVDVIFGGTNYDPDNPPSVTLTGGGSSGNIPATPATATAIVGADGVITGFTITNAGSGYVTTPNVSIASPGQALVQAVLDTDNPDPVTGRFAVKEFVVTNQGRNYRSAPSIEVAAPYDFTLDADEVDKFAESFAQVVIGRIEGQHLFHSPEAAFDGAVVLRAPRAGGTLDVASFSTAGPVSIVGSGSTFHFDAAGATVSGSSISIDDNVIVHEGVSGVATAASGEIVIFGAGKGMIDGDPNGDDVGDDEDLRLAAETTVTVTGAIGSRWKLDDLTVASATRGAIMLQQSVALTGDLDITGGAVTIGGIVDVAGDLVIDASSMVTFQADVTVGGNLVIRNAANVTFAGRLTVGGSITLEQVPGTIRFGDLVDVVGDTTIAAGGLIEVLGGFMADGSLTLVADAIDLKGGVATVVGSSGATLVLQPATASRPIRVGTPLGSSSGTLDVSDADLAAIAAGWGGVVIGHAASGTGAVTIGSIGTQQGSRNSWLASATTIVGGSVNVTQKVDVSPTAEHLRLVARTGDVTVGFAINETAAERNAWVRLEAAGTVAVNAAVRSTGTVTIMSGSTTTQSATGPIVTGGLRVSSGGAVTLESTENAFDTLAVVTTDDAISIRENSGYTIGTVDGVSGISVGSATATLRSGGTVGQTTAGLVSAATLALLGAGGTWTLTEANTIGTLTADTGSLSVADVAELTVGSITASKASGTAVELRAPSGLTLADAITTAGGDVVVHHAATLAADVVIDVVDGSAVGEVEFRSTVDATAAGTQSLTVTGKLDAQSSIGLTTALKSLSVSDAATLAGGETLTYRTVGNQTYRGTVTSTGTVTVQAGIGAAVEFLGNVSLDGLKTANANYDVLLTGASVAIANTVVFNNTGTVTLGDDADDELNFRGGVTSSAPTTTRLAGTISTDDADAGTPPVDATFGRKPGGVVELTANTRVFTGSGNATFVGTVNGPHRLVVNAAGDTTFSSAVGGGSPLAHLETDAAGRTLLDGGAITTGSPTSQVYNDDVVLGETTTLTANGGGAVTFFKSITGARSLTVNTSGTTTFGGNVSVLSLTTDADGITRLGANVTTSAPAGQVFNDAVTLTANAALSAGAGAITFAKTVDGGFDLAVNTAGTAEFGGKVGDGTPLASLTTDALGTSVVTGGLVRTSGQQAWRDDVVHLGNDAAFRSVDAAITAGASTTFTSSGKRASLTAATGIGTAAAPIRVSLTEVTAEITGSGDIYLVGAGDLVIGSAGLLTPAGQISLAASGDIRVPTGGRIAAGGVAGQGVSATKPIRWSVLGTADSGAGSLRQVIANANTTGVAGVTVFSGASSTFIVGSRLPVIASPLTIDGTGHGVVIDANRLVDSGLILQAAAAGSVVRGLTLRNFTGFGITLDGVRNALVDRTTVTSLNTVDSMGLLARGELAGTKVVGSTFSGGLRGALLDGARNLVFGEIGNGNVLSDNRAAPSNPGFAGTGIRAQGVLTGTVVAGNTFTNNNYGFAFIGANNLRLERNVFTRNSVAGIYIEGDSRGSNQTTNQFGTSRTDRNKVNVLRAKGSKFGGAVVTPVGQPQTSVAKKRN